ncbi:hypothetical protein LIER_10006 [Lithospermum erythrorhizon]|uniref:Uncharacterized protein n=1 Tax=Lithospermum erythrorhizon TaxID=34254 RepID=A0AAV3PK25_LITER
MLKFRCSSVEWKPSAVLALATSPDQTQVAAARADGSLEIWLVSPGSVGWHSQLTIHGDPDSRVSSLVWCQTRSNGLSACRLLSSSLDGSVSEWDLFDLTQKTVLDTIGVTLWQMAAEPFSSSTLLKKSSHHENGHVNFQINGHKDDECSESEVEDESVNELYEETDVNSNRLAIACDDGCVRIYRVTDEDKLTYVRSMPRVSGRTLSVAWSTDACRIFSGSSDGFIRCWDAKLGQEVYRITVGLGGQEIGHELCIWSLLALRNGTLVSGDSTGSVQFWDSHLGTLLNVHSYHRGDVSALAASTSHNRVFAAGSDGQVILYKLSSNPEGSNDGKLLSDGKKWVYVCKVKAHTHDIRALTIAVPICQEVAGVCPDKKEMRTEKLSYHKWAQLGVPMLVSGGDDAKLYAYSAREFTKFAPHDICPAPQRIPIQLELNTVFKQNNRVFDKTPLLLIQNSRQLDICTVHIKNASVSENGIVGPATDLVALAKCRSCRKIICSTISSSGMFFAYSDQVKPKLFELKRSKAGKTEWTIGKQRLPVELPFAHSMIFSSDSSRLMIAGQDRMIYIVDVGSSQLLHVFTPCRKDRDEELPPAEPPITKMFTSNDGQWLAAVNCFGDVYIFNLEIQRQHWFISRLDGASVAAGGFAPGNSNVLIISTSSNQMYAFDVEAKQLGEWSMRHTFSLPRRYQDFPGEVIGLSFQPSSCSSSVIAYSPRSMCAIDFGVPVEVDDDKAKLKRKSKEKRPNDGENFVFSDFRDPVLFVGHLSKNSLLIIDKPWIGVAEGFDAKPVHRHIYGT